VIPVLERVLAKQLESRKRRSGEEVNVENGIADYLIGITEGLKV